MHKFQNKEINKFRYKSIDSGNMKMLNNFIEIKSMRVWFLIIF